MSEVNLIGAIGAIAYSLWRYSHAAISAERRLEAANATIRIMANTDVLTGVSNRRNAHDILEAALDENRGSSPVVGMADIDDFKAINDRYGHECGDEVLKSVCSRLQGGLRKGDSLGRWGGEEFLIILRDSDASRGFETMERLRRLIAEKPIEWTDKSIAVSVTIGMAVAVPDRGLEAVVDAADRLLYEGKRSGKNKVVADIAFPGSPAPLPSYEAVRR